jgi:hypothetical protein
LKSGSLSLLEPYGPLQACNGIDLPLLLPHLFCCYLPLRFIYLVLAREVFQVVRSRIGLGLVYVTFAVHSDNGRGLSQSFSFCKQITIFFSVILRETEGLVTVLFAVRSIVVTSLVV